MQVGPSWLLLRSQMLISQKRPRGRLKSRQLHLDWPPLFAVLNPPGNSNPGKELFELDPAGLQGARDAIQLLLCYHH